MSVGRQGKTTNWPDDVIGQKVLDERQSVWGEIPGQLVAFNPATQTATVKPLYKPKFNGKPVDMPELMEIPVRFTRAGGGMGVTFPVKAGDKVTLRPQMRSSENYHVENDGSASDARSFNLSDMEAFLDGGESLSDPIQNFDSMNAHIRFNASGSYGIKGSPDGKLSITGSQGELMDLLEQTTNQLKTGFSYLSLEPELAFKPQYAQISIALEAIRAKLEAMTL